MSRSSPMLAAGLAVMLLQALGGGTAEAQTKPVQSEVLALAKSYSFVHPLGPVETAYPLPKGTGVVSADAPKKITIARAVPSVTPAPSGKVIIALISSDKPYPFLGIAAGNNYVWRDESSSSSKKWVTYMVPELAGADPKRLKRTGKKYSDGEHTEPRLVHELKRRGLDAFGACLDDPMCGSGHCGYGNVY